MSAEAAAGLFLFLFLPTSLNASCWFGRHYGQLMRLNKVNGGLVGARVVTTVSQCEAFCLDHLTDCLAANLVPIHRGVYSCQLVNAVSVSDVVQSTGALFVEKTDFCTPNPCQNGGTCRTLATGYICTCPGLYSGPVCEVLADYCMSDPCQNGGTCVNQDSGYSCTCDTQFSGTSCENEIVPVEIVYCTASSDQGTDYTCENAYDNITDPGAKNEWASYLSDENPWVKFAFSKLTTIVYADVWYRCRGVDQFSSITIRFPESEQTFNHACSNNDNWLDCTAEPVQRYNLDAVTTDNVTIVGTTECDSSGYTGFREVKFWGY